MSQANKLAMSKNGALATNQITWNTFWVSNGNQTHKLPSHLFFKCTITDLWVTQRVSYVSCTSGFLKVTGPATGDSNFFCLSNLACDTHVPFFLPSCKPVLWKVIRDHLYRIRDMNVWHWWIIGRSQLVVNYNKY